MSSQNVFGWATNTENIRTCIRIYMELITMVMKFTEMTASYILSIKTANMFVKFVVLLSQAVASTGILSDSNTVLYTPDENDRSCLDFL